MRIADQAPARRQHHRPVPLHENRERNLIALIDESSEEFAVGQVAGIALIDELPQVT
jgi:hypothetical protein